MNNIKKILLSLLIVALVSWGIYAANNITSLTQGVSEWDIITSEYYNNLNWLKSEWKMCKYSWWKLVCLDDPTNPTNPTNPTCTNWYTYNTSYNACVKTAYNNTKPLDCNYKNSTTEYSWYVSHNRCPEQSWLDYRINETNRLVKPIFEDSLRDVCWTDSDNTCFSKLFCDSWARYIDNTNLCSINKLLNGSCPSWYTLNNTHNACTKTTKFALDCNYKAGTTEYSWYVSHNRCPDVNWLNYWISETNRIVKPHVEQSVRDVCWTDSDNTCFSRLFCDSWATYINNTNLCKK